MLPSKGDMLNYVFNSVSPTLCRNVSKLVHFGKILSMKSFQSYVTGGGDLTIKSLTVLNQVTNKHPTPHGLEPSQKPGVKDSETTHTPWKTVQTRRSRSRGTNIENNPRGKLNPREPLTPINQRGHAPLTDSHVLRNQQIQTVTG